MDIINKITGYLQEKDSLYDEFFEKKMKEWNIDSPDELSDKEKKKFFDEVDRQWKAKNESFTEVNEEDEFTSDLLELMYELLDTFDLDTLNEEQVDLLNEFLDFTDEDNSFLDERRKEMVIRNGKRIRKLKCKEGYKAIKGKCVRMTSSERRVRSRSAKYAAKKRKGKKSQIQRKRQRSLKKSK